MEQGQRILQLHQECKNRDTDKDGKITEAEYRDALLAVRDNLTDEELDDLVRASEQDEGDIDYIISIQKLQWS